MNSKTFWATTIRVLRQLLADRRTIGLILAVPTGLLVLIYFVYRDVPLAPHAPAVFPHIALTMLGILPMLVMFLVTSVAMQRERSSGTLERLWTTRLHRGDLLAGYAAAFGLTAVVQALLLCAVAYWFLGLTTAGAPSWVLLVAALGAVVGVALGLLTSAFARTEFQAVQFMPVVIGPQVFLCGLLVARDQMPWVLRWVSDAMPMSYAVDALQNISVHAEPGSSLVGDLLVMAGFGVASLLVASVTMPRMSR